MNRFKIQQLFPAFIILQNKQMAEKGKIEEEEFNDKSIAIQQEEPWTIARKNSKAMCRFLTNDIYH